MTNLFNRPFARIESSREKLVFVLAFGLFIFLFLFIFRPFGMDQLRTSQMFFLSLGFGFVTIFVLVIFKFLLEPLIINDKWTFGKSLLWGVAIAFSIGIANYFYAHIIFHQLFIFKYLFISIWTAVLVGIIPATVSYIVSFNRIYRGALKDASISPDKILWENEVIIRGGNPRNECKLNPQSIVYLSSNDNYITVVSSRNNELNKIHLTLSAAEKELSRNSSFIRCHKCYIVNTWFADHLIGNIQNLKIRLKVNGIEIPVSRSKAYEVTERIK